MKRDGFILIAVLVAATMLAVVAGALGLALRQGLHLTAGYTEAVVRMCLNRRVTETLKYEYRQTGLPAAREFDERYDTMTLHVRVVYEPQTQQSVPVHAYRVTTTGYYGSTTYVLWLPAGGRHA